MRIVFFWIIALLLTGCNGDIFVKRTSLEVSEVELDGDGGSVTLRFQPDGLKAIYIDSSSSGYILSYFDGNGEQIGADVGIRRISKVEYESAWMLFDVDIDGDMLTLTSVENSAGHARELFVRLEYGFATEVITVSVLPGEIMTVQGLEYVMDQAYVDTLSSLVGEAVTYNNVSDHNMTVTLHPYRGKPANAVLDPDEYWARSFEVKTYLPEYVDGQWTIGSGEVYDMYLGYIIYYVTDRIDRELTESVEIPPHTTMRVMCLSDYSTIHVPFSALLCAPVSGRQTKIYGTCRVSEPVNYTVTAVEVSDE